MMEIIHLKGTEKRLYQLVAPLVMDPEILRKNNNYPFKTGEDYTWFLAWKNKKVVGFMPVQLRNNSFIINNYYVDDRRPDALKALVEAVIAHCREEAPIYSVTLIEHESVFTECGFVPDKKWKLYIKMKKE